MGELLATMTKTTVDISGMGGGYEAMRQTMLWRGVLHLAEVNPPVEMWKQATSYANTYGVLSTEGADLKALEASMLKPGDDCTSAMHQAVMSHLAYIHKNGVERWIADVRAKEPARIYEAEVSL